MTSNQYRRQLLRDIETELAAVGFRPTSFCRLEMARLLEQLDHAKSRKRNGHTRRSLISIGHDLNSHRDVEEAGIGQPLMAREPADWLNAVECA